ncbi:hypothetical protein [Ornithinimicrobium pekingense]|uniref:Secreted protein n=1 Tax=Ornithinimicrobium pekingense TaxID=384677 RepID=A0ABQ2F717_9MICO|nr:hypothetical protein [Ornithinimicrobium pekingense]GGK68251.1 hypothetical protein GCM10011509_15810 [Ornithinimicrobium pekingense]
MSSPAGRPAAAAQGQGAQASAPAPGGATSQGAATQSTQNAPAQAGGGQTQPAQQATPATPDTQRSSTPRLLRVARGLATAAALLTGVVATGTFDTGGVNSTPNVIAEQWVAAEEARVEIAQADLVAARGVAEAVAGQDPAVDLEPALTAAADAHTRSGATGARAGTTAADLVRTGLLTRDALDVAATDPAAAAELYGAASALAQDAGATAEDVAGLHATDLQTGSRSLLTAVVGMVSTALLGAVLVWLALRTRRIVNVPLLLATAITGWLTYVSLNPGALPLNIDQRVDEATTVATALQEVRQARQAEYATVLGLEGAALEDTAGSATEAVGAVGEDGPSAAWEAVVAGHDAVTSAEGPEARLEAVRATEDAWAQVDLQLQQRLDQRLEPATASIGTPAAVTSGVALLLGLVAAAAAWSGLTRRLRDYR